MNQSILRRQAALRSLTGRRRAGRLKLPRRRAEKRRPFGRNGEKRERTVAQSRVRIVDVAEALGLSTATISNVIHGKTAKLSDETVKRVQQELERTGYIPNMAGILLARNDSRIIGVVINDNEKYEGGVLEDGFVTASLNALSREANQRGFFLMIKTAPDIREIPAFASMWNMDGLILMGFCEADYRALREQMRISFVVYDGYFEGCARVVNLEIDHYDGGRQAGQYARELGHKRALCISDNYICMDRERIEGFRAAFMPGETTVWQLPKTERERTRVYQKRLAELAAGKITVIFAVSDHYALELMRFLQSRGLRIPQDVQMIGFDDSRASRECHPALTTIHQDAALRAKTALACIEAMRDGKACESGIVLPVKLIRRNSTEELL